MVIKKPKTTTTKIITGKTNIKAKKLPSSNVIKNPKLPSINEIPSTGGLINVDTSQQVAPGSPTTGNSDIVSPAIIENNKRRAVTPREEATNVNSKQAAESLRISEKRKLVTNLSRAYIKHEPIVTKTLKYFADNNLLIDPLRQKLLCDCAITAGGNAVVVLVEFDKINKNSLSSSETALQLGKLFKDAKVIPLLTEQGNKKISVQVSYRNMNKR